MNTPSFKGIVRFKVAGQKALPKWAQQAITNALNAAEAPPESLRFQCRIATDAKLNFERVELGSGETLTLNKRGNPQFGKNRDGLPYLTVTVVYSGDGESYRLRWIGDAVPPKMQSVAVKHDQGLSVAPVVIGLNLARAEVTPSYSANDVRHPTRRDYKRENGKRGKRPEGGFTGITRAKRRCARITESDLTPA